MIRILLAMIVVWWLDGVADANATKRVALVIGNSAYEHATPLANPKNDAEDMTAKLEDLGFEVVSGLDLNYQEMRRTVREFARKLVGSELALFFYAGHGLQVNGQNYMVPIDARLAEEIDLEFEALPINLVMSAMERSTNVNLVFLDACRDNPLARNLARSMGTRSGAVGRGLAKLGSGIGSLIAFATQPGNVALDGTGRNSPFTTALLEHLGTPGQDVTRDLIYVRRAVLEATDGKQVPWDNSSLTGEVILKSKPQEAQSEAVNDTSAGNDGQFEIAYWNSIKDANSKAYFETYIKQYPEGRFAPIARLKIAEIEIKAQERTAELEAEKARQKEMVAEAARLKSEKASAEQAAQEAQLAAEKREAELEAFRKRLADLEAERKNEEEAAQSKDVNKRDDGVQIAALDTPDPIGDVEEPEIDPKEDRVLVRSLQAELNRVGCSAGKADGIWGRKTSSAIDNYAKHGNADLASLDPSAELLDDIKKRKARICPLVCGRNQEKKNGKCVTIKQEAKAAPNTDTNNTNNQIKSNTRVASCPADATRASYQIRSQNQEGGSGVRTGTIIQHPCGKSIMCSKVSGARRCFWQ